MQVFLNGQFMPLESAKISPMDRGFLFGEGVYEVIPVFKRRPFETQRHLARMQRGFDALNMENPLSEAKWLETIAQVVASSAHADQALYIQVTRGAFDKRDFVMPPKGTGTPTIFMIAFPMNKPSEAQISQGVDTVSAEDTRWHHCNLKTTSLLGAVLLRQQSYTEQCVETVLFRDGFLSEASSSNIFVVQNDELLIVPADHHILRGITYEVIVELAQKHGMKHTTRPISQDEVRNAQELWVTSSLKNVLAITTLDGQKVGHGAQQGLPGPHFKKMAAWLSEYQAV